MIQAVIFDCLGVLSQTDGRREEPAIALVRSLRGTHKTALLSNINRQFVEQLFNPQELAELFDVVLLSGELKIAKPALEVYDLAAQRLGVLPEECVMIDDSEANVEAARRAGMQGILFETAKQCQAELTQLLEKHHA